jgi:HTH-type transcriptional regulator/antitoxin HigA
MPRPIHDNIAYDNTVEMIDRLAGHQLNADQADYLEALSLMVEEYDKANYPLPAVRGVEALRQILETNALGGDELAKILKVDRSVAFKILKGTRRLTAQHIASLATHFKVEAGLFISES